MEDTKIHVNYEMLHNVGNNLYEIGVNEIEKKVKLIFEEEITSLNNNGYWRGKRYNMLIDEVNKVIPKCKEMLNLIEFEIPNSIYAIAENYSRNDTDYKERLKKASQIFSLNEVVKGTEEGIDFDKGKVEEIKATIAQQFKDILIGLDNYLIEYKKRDWKGKAEDTFTDRINKVKTGVEGAFNELSNQFATLMQQTIDDMKNTEKANGGNGADEKIHVQYEELHRIGKRLYEIAEKDIKNPIKAIYETDIPSMYMKTIWRGKRYNILVEEFNKLIPQCKETIKLVGIDIPSTVYGIANNYASFDQETQRAEDEVIKDTSIAEIAKGDENALDFNSMEVDEAQRTIIQKFAQIIVGIEEYEEEYNKKEWEGSAEQAFTEKIRNTKEKVNETFKNISKSFSNLMEGTITDIINIENENTVGQQMADRRLGTEEKTSHVIAVDYEEYNNGTVLEEMIYSDGSVSRVIRHDDASQGYVEYDKDGVRTYSYSYRTADNAIMEDKYEIDKVNNTYHEKTYLNGQLFSEKDKVYKPEINIKEKYDKAIKEYQKNSVSKEGRLDYELKRTQELAGKANTSKTKGERILEEALKIHRKNK